MAKSKKVIITCAVTGAIHTPSMSPYLPITAQQIADAALGAAEAGAAIVHLHARDPKDGRPDQRPEAFQPFLKVIKQSSNVVINLTTGGAPTMMVEERVRPAATLKPEVASLNMGTMNFGLYPMIPRFKGKFKHDWEEPYLENSKKGMFKNTFADIEYILTTCAENNTRFEIECYDIGHLYTLRHFLDRGLVKAPLFIQSVFGILGGIGPHPEDVMQMKRTADRLFWRSVSLVGASAPGAISFRSRRWRRRWAAMSASASRTRYGSAPASSRNRMRSRSGRRGRSSKASASRSQIRTRRAKSFLSRAATRWGSRAGTASAYCHLRARDAFL